MKLQQVFSFIAGLMLTANFSLYPSAENAPRLLDVFVVTMSAITISQIFVRYLDKRVCFLIFAALFFMGWAIFGSFSNDTSLVVASIRLTAALLAIISLNLFLKDEDEFRNLLLGGAVGATVISFIALGQKLNLGSFFYSVIPAGTPIWWGDGGQVRAVGIYQHPNGLSQSQAIGAVMALTLIWKERLRYAGYALFFFIVASTYFATSTRAGIVAAVFSFLIVHALHPSGRYRLFTIILTWPFVPILAIVGPELLGDRWTGVTASGMTLSDNLHERLTTTVNSFWGILTYPIGLGVNGRNEFLYEVNNGITASHNSYLSFGLTFGIVSFIVLVGSILLRVLKGKRDMLYPVIVVISLQLFAEDSIFSGSVQFGLIVGLLGGFKFLHTKIRHPGSTLNGSHTATKTPDC